MITERKQIVLCGVITAFFALPALTFAQTRNPLPPEAFNKMIIQDLTYAITGESTPVSGLKVDISKPEGTISGMFPAKKKSTPWDVFSFELKGGVTEKNFSFLKGLNSANSAFEFRPSFHFFTWYNSAKFGKPSENGPKKKILYVKNDIVIANEKKLIDTFYVFTVLYNRHLEVLNDTKPLPPEVLGVTEAHQKIAAKLIPKLLKNDALYIGPGHTWTSILAYLPKASLNGGFIDPNTYNNDLVEMYKKYKKLYDNRKDDTLDKMIANAGEIWTKKKYFWLTLSPYVRTEKVNEYFNTYQGRDSLYFKSDYRWYTGLALNANRYWVTPNKLAVLLRGTVSISRNNNLSTLSSYNYETRSPFFQYGTVVTEKSKTGTAYNNTDIRNGFEKQLSAELYILPLATLVPGFYVSGNLSQSDLYKLPSVIGRADDKIKIGTEGGLVFNINNRDKDKTLLSIITYFRYEDLTDKRRTSAKTGLEETKDDFQKRNISFGIKVGIPITLPKKSS